MHVLKHPLQYFETVEHVILLNFDNRIDGKPPIVWPWTSTVVTAHDEATCPISQVGGSCDDAGCSACWDRNVKTVKYLKH